MINGPSLKSLFWSSSGTIGQQVGNFGVFLLLTRQLEPTVIGIAAMASAVFDLLTVFARMGLSDIITRAPEVDERYLSTAFWTAGIGGIIIAGGLVITAPILGQILGGMPELSGFLQLIAIGLVINGFSPVFEGLLVRDLRFKTLAARNVGATLSSGGIAVVLAFSGFGILALVAQKLVYAVWMLVAMIVACDWHPSRIWDAATMRRQFRAGFVLTAAAFLGMGNQRILDIIVGSAFGAAALGYMRIAWRILELMLELTVTSINRVLLPQLSRVQKDTALFNQTYYHFVRLTAILTFPLFAGAALVAPDVLPLIFGAKWTPSVPLMQLLATMIFFIPLIYYKSSAMFIANRLRLILWLNMIEFALSISIALAAAYVSIEAIALGNTIRTALATPIILTALSRAVGLKASETLRSVAEPLVATIVMAIVVVLADFQVTLTLRILIEVSAGVMTYCVVLMALYCTTPTKIFKILRDIS